VSDGGIDVMPEVLVTGGGGSFEGLAATLIQAVRNGTLGSAPERPELAPSTPTAEDGDGSAAG
jgi:hypothetical protein